MSGFFTKKQVRSTAHPDGKIYSCVSCGLSKKCSNPKLTTSGAGEKGILNVFPSPSAIDDKTGKVFRSKDARFLKKVYDEVGIDLDKDCVNTYGVSCYTEKQATTAQIIACRKRLMHVIDEIRPKLIVFFGDTSLYSLIGNRWKKDLGNINKWRGFVIPDQVLSTWIAPMLDVNKVLSSTNKVEEVIFKQDLKKAVQHLTIPFRKYHEPEIIYLDDDLSIFDKITVGNVAFDYETTGLKPHAKGHRIVCASLAISEDKVYTFKMPTNRSKRKPFTDLMQREEVGKMAHNIKFEDTWTNVRLKVPVKNWLWDSMQAAHIIDNRQGISGLKFQTYVNFGIIDYDSDVSPYLKSKEKNNANALNNLPNVMDDPVIGKEVLKYCAYDSIFQYRLSMLQRKYIIGTQGETYLSPRNSNFPNAYTLFHKGILSLARAERNGLRIDLSYISKQKHRLTKKIELLEKKIYASSFYRHWKHTTKGTPNLNSGTQLGHFLYIVKKITPKKLTDTGKGSTDEEALQMLNIEELKWILERTKLLKIRDTYLTAFEREQVNGVLHPFFNLHLARTYRSSSSNPNFQNIPKRDKKAMKIVRGAIIPRPGHQFLEMDFSGLEVSIAACYHKDPIMIKYLTDKGTDMHGDTAKQIFKIPDFDRHLPEHNLLRAATKNSFIFPQFYGDYYANNANNMCSNWLHLPQGKWKKDMGVPLNKKMSIAEHLINVGIKSYTDFENHLKDIEYDFWNNRFKVYNNWKKKHYSQYLKNGYSSLYTGFVVQGVMGRNDVINYPVQGAAFHCLLWTFIEVDKALRARKMRSKIVGQIHDAIVLDVHPTELEHIYNIITYIATVQLPEAFKWINVPLSIDAEVSPVDGSWAERKEYSPEFITPF